MKFSSLAFSLSLLSSVSAFSPSSVRPLQNSPASNTLSQRYATKEAVNGDATKTTEDSEKWSSNMLNDIRLSVEEKAKTVVTVTKSGTLCTKSNHDGIEGAPFGSFVDYVLDDDGNPVLLMNDMSMHTININSDVDGLVTLFAQFSGKKTQDKGQDVSRCSITGKVEKIDPETAEDIDALRMRYSIAHAYADQVMDSPRFAFYRIKPEKVYFVGGFGVLAKWVPVDQYRHAASDILAMEAGDIVSKLNKEHMDDLQLTATHLLGCTDIEKIRVTNFDRLGFDVRVTTKGRRKNKLITDEFRIGFRIPVISVEDAKSEVLKIFQEAWEIGNGYDWGEEGEAGDDVPIVKIAADSLD
jgi:putative heme iron utilization protein